MKFCIIYKYTTTKNKFQLEKDLEQLSSILNDMGHDTFIFDRDIKIGRTLIYQEKNRQNGFFGYGRM